MEEESDCCSGVPSRARLSHDDCSFTRDSTRVMKKKDSIACSTALSLMQTLLLYPTTVASSVNTNQQVKMSLLVLLERDNRVRSLFVDCHGEARSHPQAKQKFGSSKKCHDI